MSESKRVLSGMRPTGALHLGHLVGALKNWVQIQSDYEGYFMVADWHALMSEYENPGQLKAHGQDMVLDWLSAGLDPDKSIIFRQSDVPEHLELHMVLSVLSPLGWVERVPTYKEQLREVKGRDIATYGFLGYPVLQTADILLYRAHCVPVGEDQIPHLELSREIVRRFKHLYKKDIFPEPKPLLTEETRLLGLDGRKMSKSYDNAMNLVEPEDGIRKKTQKMLTDVKRGRLTDPGHPEECNTCHYWQVFAPEEAPKVWEECRNATRGCGENKKQLAEKLIALTQQYREGRTQWGSTEKAQRDHAEDVLRAGTAKARACAQETMNQVKEAIGM